MLDIIQQDAMFVDIVTLGLCIFLFFIGGHSSGRGNLNNVCIVNKIHVEDEGGAITCFSPCVT